MSLWSGFLGYIGKELIVSYLGVEEICQESCCHFSFGEFEDACDHLVGFALEFW